MSESSAPGSGQQGDFFDQLLDKGSREQSSFKTALRGYEKAEVDAAITTLRSELERLTNDLDASDQRHQAALEAANEKHRAELNAVIEKNRADLERMLDERTQETAQTLRDAQSAIERLEAQVIAERARADEAASQVAALTAELVDAPPAEDEPQSRQQFEAVLRVAEEQASVLIRNAAVQAERLLEAARDDAAVTRSDAEADRARITEQAEHDANQVRLRIETEYTAHEARIEREAAHAAEKVAQAVREAEAIRTEAEKGAANLRALVTREVNDLRADAERDVREMTTRTLEFEETLTRRQDDAQQEFLVLHNQAVAHAERITNDANEQVEASLEHAQRISAKAEDYEKLMRAQAQAIEADAQVRARETLERARAKAEKIVTTVTTHATSVLRDAEDRTRQLRWQQQQLNSFMAEVGEMLRPEGATPEHTMESGHEEGTAGSGVGSGAFPHADVDDAPAVTNAEPLVGHASDADAIPDVSADSSARAASADAGAEDNQGGGEDSAANDGEVDGTHPDDIQPEDAPAAELTFDDLVGGEEYAAPVAEASEDDGESVIDNLAPAVSSDDAPVILADDSHGDSIAAVSVDVSAWTGSDDDDEAFDDDDTGVIVADGFDGNTDEAVTDSDASDSSEEPGHDSSSDGAERN